MATHEYDAVIIGSGHNGLIVGNYLAMAGLSVCVLEANDMIGGCTTTVECTLPGFKHDIGSVALGAIQSNPVYANDELGIREKYGFEFIDTKKNGATLYPDGTGVVEDGDLAHELAQIAAYSPEDAQAYGQFIQEKARLLPLISTGMSTCPPPMGLFVNQLNSTPEGRDLFKSMSMSALQMARQWFKHPKTISHVLKISTEVMVTPEDAGSAMWMMFVTVGNAFRSGSLPKGGSIALPNALAAALKDRGGEIILNKKVVKINVEDGRAVSVETADGDTYVGTKAIISNVDARRVFLEMVDGYELDPKFKRDLEQIIPAPMSGVMQAVAIDDAPHYKAGPEFDDAVVVEPIPRTSKICSMAIAPWWRVACLRSGRFAPSRSCRRCSIRSGRRRASTYCICGSSPRPVWARRGWIGGRTIPRRSSSSRVTSASTSSATPTTSARITCSPTRCSRPTSTVSGTTTSSTAISQVPVPISSRATPIDRCRRLANSAR